jgi:septum formation protein
MRNIILASQSPHRKTILEKTGWPFTVEVSGFEEDLGLKMPPPKLAIAMAEGKAAAVAARHKNAVVIGADTFVIYRNELYGKPHTAENARRYLKTLCGAWHDIVTGLVIIDTKTGKRHKEAVKTRVHLRKAFPGEIEAYVKTGEPLRVAGGYAMQSGAASLVDSIDGCYWNVVGLPLASLVRALRKFDVHIR